MLFNSWPFAVFFVFTTLLYFLLPYGARWALLLAASCLFYMAFVPIYILILLLTIVVDYFAAIQIENHTGTKRHAWLVVSIVSTCAILFYFKYYDFAAANVNGVAAAFGLPIEMKALHLLLPIGLSFHTFQSLSYVIEVYRGNQKAERHFGIYSLYVMFYPQLVAGPIERPQNLLHQFYEHHDFDYERVTSGLKLMAWGLFKKAVIADRLALFVTPVYQSPTSYDGGTLIVATLFFSFQIFCDFSGYTDIARGAARVLGFKLMVNFNRPYAATSLSEFWRRWHISLSTWLRDYLYQPLALQLRYQGLVGVATALLITFFISGLWHGANWTFVIWGLLNGAGLALEAIFAKQRKKLSRKMPTPLFNFFGVFTTFAFVNFTYVFFRSRSLSDAMRVLQRIGSWFFPAEGSFTTNVQTFLDGISTAVVSTERFEESCVLILFLVFVHFIQSRPALEGRLFTAPWWIRWPIYQLGVLVLAFYGLWFENRSFIYFQF